MHRTEQEALADLVDVTACLLEHDVLPHHVVGVRYLPNLVYEVVVFENPCEAAGSKRVEVERVQLFSGASYPNSQGAIWAATKFRQEFGIHDDFTFTHVEGTYKKATWLLVHHYSHFARHVCGTGVPLARSYSGEPPAQE